MQRCLLTLCLLLAGLALGCGQKAPVAYEPPPLPSKEELSKLKIPPGPLKVPNGKSRPSDLPALPDGTVLPPPGELPDLSHIPPPPPPRKKKVEKK